MVRKVKCNIGGKIREFEVYENPVPHIIVDTVKSVVHGWYYGFREGKRECSSERILLNPYNGCTVNCPMCYSRSFKGYFDLWNKYGVVTVFRDFDDKLKRELDTLYWASCGYLSPATEPFQRPLENLYHLSEKAANVMLNLNLPVNITTKQGDNVPYSLIKRLAEHPYGHCILQFTILSLNEDVNEIFAPNASSFEDQLKSVRLSADMGIHTVIRMDPILPGITDNIKEIEYLVERGRDEGASHFIFSVCDIGWFNDPRRRKLFKIVKEHFPSAYDVWRRIYRFSSDGDITYRKKLFKHIRRICDNLGVTMALCMEFEKIKVGDKIIYKGLNDEFMSSKTCDGSLTPIYYRSTLSEPFKPLEKCNGACLLCAKGLQKPTCNIKKFINADSLTLRDYKHMKPKLSNLKSFI
ncbi:MAG: hypothetical protein DRJ30_01200 [Candidatus Methanomethylicota archaeon]|nr:MAG: hypothetical protein DRJ30_01200 [Candidatus Verstraetearchaeota archaeon]